jgi:hypothetical protein
MKVPVVELFANVPRASRQWMAARVAALPRILIDYLILTLIRALLYRAWIRVGTVDRLTFQYQ